jgi:hypothetical protein
MTYSIRHTNGTTETHEAWAEAWAAMRAVYGPETVVYAGDGGECDEVCAPDLSCGRALVWQTEDDSRNDDGQRAVASVTQTG